MWNNSEDYVGRKTHQGAPASDISPDKALRRSVLSCLLWEDTFYESGCAIADRIKNLIPSVEPGLVSQLAIEARTKHNLRKVPLLIAEEMTKHLFYRSFVGDVLSKIIERPDELSAFVDMYWKDGKKSLSKQVKRGLAKAFTKFDEYQISKYKSRGEKASLRDIMFLVHPKPLNPTQAELWKKLADKKLNTAHTWETMLSDGKDKKETFEGLLRENKLGALALLKNLRNMTESNVPVDLIESAILRMNVSKVFPYRFITAARYAPRLKSALEQAMFKSISKLGTLDGKTILLVDVSGSMSAAIGRTNVSRMDAATGLAILLREMCVDVSIYTFSNNLVKVANSRGFTLIDDIQRSQSHSNTYLGTALNTLHEKDTYDRIIIITDEQSSDVVCRPEGKGYIINVASYENGIGYGDWVKIDGFSEAVIEWLKEYETEDMRNWSFDDILDKLAKFD